MSEHAGAHITYGRASHLSMISDPEGVERVIERAAEAAGSTAGRSRVNG